MSVTTTVNGRALLDRLASTELSALAAHFAGHGIHISLVGGPVRDLILGLDPKDLDVTSPATPEMFHRILESFSLADVSVTSFDVGELHGTIGVLFRHLDGTETVVEHTTHRTEVYEPGSRTPSVAFGTDLGEDLARRDFTVNAIAIDLVDGHVTDLFGGVADLAAGVLRCPGDPLRIFEEDPLRICRLVRFAATRGWAPDPTTAAAARDRRDRLTLVSAERVAAELSRICAAGGAAFVAAVSLCEELTITDEVLGVPPGSVPLELCSVDDPDALRAALARCSAQPSRWMRDMRATRADMRLTADTLAVLDAAAVSPLDLTVVRHKGPRAAELAELLCAPFGIDPAPLAAATADGRLFDPLPVTGTDAIAAGLIGVEVGAAIAAVTAAFCENPALSRADALTIIASTR